MRRRSLLTFVILNVIVTSLTAFGIIRLWPMLSPQPTRQAVSPLFVAVTTTPDPKETRVIIKIVTATPGAGSAPLTTPDGNENTATALAEIGAVPTLDPSLLPPGLPTTNGLTADNGTAGAGSATPATDKNGCQTYAIKKGDTLGSIATSFGLSLADLMRANKLTEADATRLQIGQVLTVPLNGCGLATEEPSATPTKFVIPTPPPTVTLAPTASLVQVEIAQVISPGDITSEGVEIRNVSGGVLQMQGWTLSDSKGHTFTFPEYRMFPGGRVTVYTRDGKNTPIVLYWGQSRPMWGDPAEPITLSDANGTVQASRSGSGSAPIDSTGQSSEPGVPTATRSQS